MIQAVFTSFKNTTDDRCIINDDFFNYANQLHSSYTTEEGYD